MRTLIALIPEDDYKKNSLVGKFIIHSKFGIVGVKNLDFKDDFINIEFEDSIKKIKMDYWEIDEKEFNGVIDESAV